MLGTVRARLDTTTGACWEVAGDCCCCCWTGRQMGGATVGEEGATGLRPDSLLWARPAAPPSAEALPLANRLPNLEESSCSLCKMLRSLLPAGQQQGEKERERVRKEVVAAPSAGVKRDQRKARSTAHWLTGVLRDGPHSGIPLLLQADLGAPEPLALPLQRPDLLTGLRHNTRDE